MRWQSHVLAVCVLSGVGWLAVGGEARDARAHSPNLFAGGAQVLAASVESFAEGEWLRRRRQARLSFDANGQAEAEWLRARRARAAVRA